MSLPPLDRFGREFLVPSAMKGLLRALFIASVLIIPLAILPLTIDYYNTPKMFISQLMMIFLLWLCARVALATGEIRVVSAGFYRALLLFAAVSGLSLAWSRSVYLGLNDLCQILTYLAAFFICINSVRREDAGMVVSCAFLAGITSGLYVIFQYLGLDFIRYPQADFADWRFKLYSTFGNPDFVANYLMMIFPAGIAVYLLTQRPAGKVLALAGLIIIYTALVLLFSVGAFIGLSCAILLVLSLAVRINDCRRFRKTAGALLLILGVISAFFFMDNKFHHPSILKKASASLAWQNGFANRMVAYRCAAMMVRDHSLEGVGIGNYKLRFPEYRGRLIAASAPREFNSGLLDVQTESNALNEYLQAWAETGIAGFIMFLVVLFTIVAKGASLFYGLTGTRERVFALGLLGGVAAFLVHCLLSFPMHITPNGLLFWTFAGLIFVMAGDNRGVSLRLGAANAWRLKIAIIVLAVAAAIWPIRIYLSEVYLKRTLDMNKKGQVEEAMKDARSSLFFNKESKASAYVASYLDHEKDYCGAAVCYRKVLGNYDEIGLRVSLADALINHGLTEYGINELKKALLLNPSDKAIKEKLKGLCGKNGGI